MRTMAIYDKLTDQFQRGFAFKVFIFFGLMLIMLGGTPQLVRSEMVDRIVAVVNDDIILNSELEEAMAPVRRQLTQSGYSPSQQSLALVEQRPLILDQLITEKLTDQQVVRFQIQISDAEIDATIERIKEMNGLSDAQFLQKLELEGKSYDAFRSEIKQQLLRTKLVNLQVKSKIVITDEDVKAYYEKNQRQYAGQTKYHLRRILVKGTNSEDIGSGQGIQDQKSARDRIERILERLKAGDSFAQLATAYSDDRSAGEGGDIGVFETRLLASNIQSILAGLEKGQYSPVIETEQGYQILFVEDVIRSEGKPLAAVKTEIQDKLFAEIVDQKFQNWLKTLRDQAHIQILE
jgi:peptidyl-prolyl cis-trans isomerase SurA